MPELNGFRRRLLRWYGENARKLPWRENNQPWPVLVSEIMLQQTRVEAVLPFYERFLTRFPTAASLAAAPESEVLALWSGLGYYSRARNLQKAARLVSSGFPDSHHQIRALPGVGPYTAAAVASIGFHLRHAAVDGNVLRVVARVTAETGDIGSTAARRRIETAAEKLLDPTHPGDFNQAMMELGATLCTPRKPRCLVCPVAQDCLARQQCLQDELPIKRPKAKPTALDHAVVIVRRQRRLLLRQRPPDSSRMPGFWELPAPEDVPNVPIIRNAGEFQHTIVNTRYRIRVQVAAPVKLAHLTPIPAGFKWFLQDDLAQIPLTTVTRKALALLST